MEEPIVVSGTDPTLSRTVHAVSRLGDALRNHAWTAARQQGLTPTQGKILALLRMRGRAGLGLSEIAEQIAVTAATASDSVGSLVDKGFVEKRGARGDSRAICIALTARGRREAFRAMHWADFLLDAFATLTVVERTTMLRSLSKVLLQLGEAGHLPTPRMCLACSFFLPFGGKDADGAHRCDFGDFDLSDADLRIDCTAYAEASGETRRATLRQFDATQHRASEESSA